MSKKQVDFEAQLGEGSAELLGKLEAALGAKGRTAILQLIKTDPEARRLATRIIGTGGPAAVKAALEPSEIAAGRRSQKPTKVEF